MAGVLQPYEVLIIALVLHVPFILIGLYPFRKKLRFGVPITVVLAAALVVFQVLAMYVVVMSTSMNYAFYMILMLLVYLVVFMAIVDVEIGRLLFTMIMLLNFAMTILVLAKCTEGLFFRKEAMLRYHWTYAIFIVIFEAAILPFVLRFFKRVYSDMMVDDADSNAWHYLWLVPGTFYLVQLATAYTGTGDALSRYLEPPYAIIRFFIMLGSVLVYSIIIDSLQEQKQNTDLLNKNNILTMQNLQYENLHMKVEEARRARHDLRHHIRELAAIADTGDVEALRRYLKEYNVDFTDSTPLAYCKNMTVNTLLLFYAQKAEENNTRFNVYVDLPEKINVSPTDLTVLLGNLLENAMEACMQIRNEEDRVIEVGGRLSRDMLFLTVDNTYLVEPSKNRQGIYLSTKHEGTGIGVESVKLIAERYNGEAIFETKAGEFRASIMLVVPPEEEDDD